LDKYNVIVVGAGPAGLLAAGRASELGARVLVLEKMERAGRKLLITGKGRCNITNDAPMAEFISHIQPNGKFLRNAFSRFFSEHIVELLHANGVETVVERGGRIFPASNKSADVLNALMDWNRKHKTEFHYNFKVEKLIVEDKQVIGVEVSENGTKREYLASSIIVAAGGNSYPATGSSGDGYKLAKTVGHTISEVRPALVPIETEGNLAEQLQGLSLKNVNAVVWVNGKKQKEDFGEMMFAHFGLTGPIILTLSRFVVDEITRGNSVEISIDLKPALDEQKLDARLLRDLNEHGKKHLDNLFREWLPSKLIPVFLEKTGIDGNKECHQVSAKERRKILNLMKDFRFKAKGYRSFKEAIITAGGINTNEIDPKTMESKVVKNLYFVGELLDLDADTGGFNLQIAYSTGWLAGESAVK
jgi:predicted Rossmann fold flavoprotein